MRPSPRSRVPSLLVTLLATCFLAACSDDTDPNPTPDAGTQVPDAGEQKPMYAVITQVNTSGESQSYVQLTDTVELTEPLSLEDAIEVPGRALGSGIPKSGSLYVSSSEGAQVTRYNLTAGGELEEAGRVSFEGRGVASIGEYQNQFQFVSATKAYYFDGRTAQAIVWNPTEMTVTNAISLPQLTVAGAITTFATHPVRVGNLVIMPVGWRPSAGVGITKQAGVVVVDTTNDSAVVETDTRCGYVRDGVVGPDGMVYLATEVYGAAVFRVAGGETPVPCLLRFDPTTKKFDASFQRDLSALTAGATTGSLLPGPQGSAYLRVLDETVYTVAPGTHPRVVASAQAWTWWQLNLSTLVATKVAGLPASTGSTFIHEVAGGRSLFTEFTNSSTTTNFRELSNGQGQVRFSTQGLAFSFVQVR
ncbi:hypothetical protein [Pyxidicoccus xibeiensis]|uniref:hypothetical protein n=1 Tax=Pyxidicoccus xibeiensis TaxID=2906759 RepID=UPI0020A6F78E|nr:hypothetical protein [Pyxidicoccus xibeiensis]MCP3144857.1 hypothetical protein [Pyxidicoccus xibeiensis]